MPKKLSTIIASADKKILSVEEANRLIVEHPEVTNIVVAPTKTNLVVPKPEIKILSVTQQGPAGPPGADGTGGDKTYVHNQIVANVIWTVTHNLGKFPSVSVVDSANTVVIGDVQYNSINSLTVVFSAAFGGLAYCN